MAYERDLEVAEWSKAEFNELRERSLKLSLWLLGIIAWGSSFRYWESAQIRDAGFFLTSLLSLIATWVFYKKKGLLAASWVCITGTIFSIMVDCVSFPNNWIWVMFAIPVLQSGILIGSSVVVWIGFIEVLLVVLSYTLLGAKIPLNPVLYYVAGTTVMIWYTSRLINSSITQTVFYAVNNKKALEEARDHQGRLVRAMKTMDESNARLVKAYDNIALLQNEADQARQQKIQFANMISHEMRAPLNFIIGATEMMVNSPNVYGNHSWPPELSDDIQRVYQSSQHLLNLINDVLALGQIEANRMVLNFSVCSLNSVINEVITILGPSFENNGLFLDVQIEPGIPSLNLDRIRIRQVLLNLISNSLRHTKKGGVKVMVNREGENIQVSVRDSGSGIPAENLANLFQEFYQGDLGEDSVNSPSSGLGLVISKQFVELHGGWIWAESPIQEAKDGEGPGSLFSFCLPLTGVSKMNALWVGQNDAYFRRKSNQAKKLETILVYTSTTSLLPSQMPFALTGYQLAYSDSEEEMAQALEQIKPCGVIQVTDAAHQSALPELPPDVPAVQCLVQWEAMDLAEMWDAYLTKPSTPDQVREALDATCGHPTKCLVIDDDPDICRFIELTFLSSGLHVDVRYAGTGSRGLKLMQSFLPDITFLDINLPDTSGWSVLRDIRSIPETTDLSVIIFSAVDNPNPVVVRLQALRLLTPSAPNSYVMNDILQGIFDSLTAPA